MAALKALVAQLAAALLVFALWRWGALPTADPLALALAQGGIAAALSLLALRQERWWPPLHLLFAPALVLAARLPLDPRWYLAAFLALAGIYWSTFRTRVPLYLTNRASAAALAALLPPDRAATLLDLGAGTGALLRRLAAARPDCRFVGIETAPLPWLASRLVASPPNLELRYGDFWRTDLAPCDLVYAFLSPVPMPALWRKASAEMRPGSLLVANSFAVPGIEAERIVAVGDRRGTRLYCYRIAARAAAPPPTGSAVAAAGN